MSQKTLKGSPEDVGSIQYSPSPSASPPISMSLQEEPGTEGVEPFFAARSHTLQKDSSCVFRCFNHAIYSHLSNHIAIIKAKSYSEGYLASVIVLVLSILL